MKYYILLLIFIFLSGCAKCPVWEPNYFPNPDTLVPISGPVVIISDNQEHAQFGTAQLVNSEVVDKVITDVTRRPAQQNRFSKYILELALSHKNLPLIHLGDFLDISCRTEYDRFMSTVKKHGKPWVLTMGNHDGYFLGNYMSAKLTESWAGLCDNGWYYDNQDHRLPPSKKYKYMVSTIHTKTDVIKRYLLALSASQIPSMRHKLFDSNGRIIGRGYWASTERPSFFHRIYWSLSCCCDASTIDCCIPYRAFIAQEIRIPSVANAVSPVSMIIVDTAQYDQPFDITSFFTKGKQAGTLGSIQDDQAKVLRKWAVENSKSGVLTIFAGHHPFYSLDERTRELFAEFASIMDSSIFYISAHTHEGGWHKHEIGGGRNIYELNVGSVNDWPIHYRTLQLYKSQKGLLVVKSEYIPISFYDTRGLGFGSCKHRWRIRKDSPVSAKAQEKMTTTDYFKVHQKEILATLHVYSDLLDKFPGGSVRRIKYAIPVGDDENPVLVKKEFSSCVDLKREIQFSIEILKQRIARGNVKDKTETREFAKRETREFARLADTINLYQADPRFMLEMKQYKACQAIQVSTMDAKKSKEYFFSPDTRYRMLQETEDNRRAIYVEIK